jgi:hypothetical protein
MVEPYAGAMGLGSPLQRVAMGLVVVFLSALVPGRADPSWMRYDALPDPLGWVLVLLGATALVRVDERFGPARWLAWLAAVVSVPLWFPQLGHQLSPSASWAASLPQLGFCLVLAREVGRAGAEQRPPDTHVAQRFGLLVWGLLLAAVLPVVVLGGGLDGLAPANQLVATVVDVALVYLLFRVHRRTWLGGPGPLEVHPRTDPETRRGRPPR